MLSMAYQEHLTDKGKTMGDYATGMTFQEIPVSISTQEYILIFGTKFGGYGRATLQSANTSSWWGGPNKIVKFYPEEVGSLIKGLIDSQEMVARVLRWLSWVFFVGGGFVIVFFAAPCIWRFLQGRQSTRRSDIQASHTIHVTAQNASDREFEINKIIEKASFSEDPFVREFGISMDSKMVMITGRVLPPPKLQYGGLTRVQAEPRQGQWDMRSKHFYQGIEIHSWAICVFAQQRQCKEEQLRQFIFNLRKISRDAGIQSGMIQCIVDIPPTLTRLNRC